MLGPCQNRAVTARLAVGQQQDHSHGNVCGNCVTYVLVGAKNSDRDGDRCLS